MVHIVCKVGIVPLFLSVILAVVYFTFTTSDCASVQKWSNDVGGKVNKSNGPRIVVRDASQECLEKCPTGQLNCNLWRQCTVHYSDICGKLATCKDVVIANNTILQLKKIRHVDLVALKRLITVCWLMGLVSCLLALTLIIARLINLILRKIFLACDHEKNKKGAGTINIDIDHTTGIIITPELEKDVSDAITAALKKPVKERERPRSMVGGMAMV